MYLKLQAAIDAICGVGASPEAQAAALVKLQESSAKLSTDAKTATDALAADQAKQKTAKIAGFLTMFSEEGKVAPALVAELGKFMATLDDSPESVQKFGEGVDAPEKSQLQCFADILGGSTPLIKLGAEIARGGDDVKDDAIDSDQAEVNEMLGISDADYSEFSEAKPGTTPQKKEGK